MSNRLRIFIIKKFPRLFLKKIDPRKLFMGGEDGYSSAAYAQMTGDTLRPSRPISQSPHVELLRDYQVRGEDVFLPEYFETTQYYKNAVKCIEVTGRYFAAEKPSDVVLKARKFCCMLDGKIFEKPEEGESEPDTYVTVRAIKSSDCYEIIDGHHRLAISFVNGTEQKCLAFPHFFLCPGE